MGINSKQEGYWEGNGYQVTWAFGHLCELKAPYEYNSDWSFLLSKVLVCNLISTLRL